VEIVEKGIFTKEKVLEIGRAVDREMKREWSSIVLKGFVL
jgi:hypothetical protein